MPHGHGRHAESPDAQGLAVSKATRDIGQESNWLLDARIGVSQRPLPRQLGRDDVDRLDHRWLRQQLGRLRHQRGSHLTAKVCLATRVVREGVEDAELRWAKADRELGNGCRFLLHQGQPSLKEAGHLGLLAGLGDQANKQPHRDHRRAPFDEHAASDHRPRSGHPTVPWGAHLDR